MRLTQTAQASSRKNTNKTYTYIGALTATPNSQNWTTASINLPRASADRNILAIITRYDTGTNGIFNTALGGAAGIPIVGLSGSASSITDLYVFRNRADTSATLTVTGGLGSITAHYHISFVALYGFGLPTVNQSSGSTDSFSNSDYRNFSTLAGGTSISISCTGIRRSPHFIVYTVTSDYTVAGPYATPNSLPADLTQLANSSAQTVFGPNRGYTFYHGISALRSSTTYSGTTTWASGSQARWVNAVPLF